MTATIGVDIPVSEDVAGPLDGWFGGAAGLLLRGGEDGARVGVLGQYCVPDGQAPQKSAEWHTLLESMH